MGILEQEKLFSVAEKLRARNAFAKTMKPDCFEPGMMEYPEQWDGFYQPETGILTLRFEAEGTGSDGRPERIEDVREGDQVTIERDPDNPFNKNNFRILSCRGKELGNMPADICNAIAGLYDEKEVFFENSFVSYVEPISLRSRYARRPVLFVELQVAVNNPVPGLRESQPTAAGAENTLLPVAENLEEHRSDVEELKPGTLLQSENTACRKEEEYFAFVSYSHQDEAEVMRIIGLLRREGYRIWFDELIEGTSDWRVSITRSIKRSQVFIIMNSVSCRESTDCLNELAIAADIRKPLLQINLDGCALSEEQEYSLRRVRAIRIKNLSDEQFLNAIRKIRMMNSVKA